MRITTQHAQVKIEGKTLASHAAPLLAEIKESLIGRPRRRHPVRTSPAKSSVSAITEAKWVALVFWNRSETAENSALNSTLRSLAEMRGGPSFVMLGVDGDDPPIADSTSNAAWWRSFQDGPDGPIARLWGVEEVPEFYVLDHEGVVRLRTFSLPLLSSAVEELLVRMPSPKLTEAISVSGEQSLDEIVPGVTADRIVVWNQHNGGRNDRGTTAFNLRLFRHGAEVWKQEGIKLPWTGGRTRRSPSRCRPCGSTGFGSRSRPGKRKVVDCRKLRYSRGSGILPAAARRTPATISIALWPSARRE